MTSEHREIDAAASALIRAFLTGDRFAVRQIMTRWVNAGAGNADGVLSIAVADMAAMMLSRVCGSRAQAAAEAQSWTDGVVGHRSDSAALPHFIYEPISGSSCWACRAGSAWACASGCVSAWRAARRAA